MVLSFFVSNIITVLGSMMDSFTVSNTMAGTAVLVYYYFRKDALVKPVFKGFTFREMLSANNAGLAPGLLSVWYSLTLMVKAELINIGISEFNAETVGLQAYNVTVQVNYFVNALMMSAVAAFGSDGGAVSGQCGA